MAINPRVAARRETEMAFLKEEDARLKDLGEKRKKEAAEKSAATKKEEDFVFYSEDDKEEENDYPTFGSDFLDTLAETEAKKNKEEDLPGFKPEEKTSMGN